MRGLSASTAGLSLVFLGTVIAPITTTAISGTIVGPALARDENAFTGAEHTVWWMVLALGAGILVLSLTSTGCRITRRTSGIVTESVPAGGRNR